MHLDLDGSGALYAQLARALKHSIIEGRLKAGSRLPATRELAHELSLSRNTVLTAYEMLCAEQLAVARSGAGTFVGSAVAARIAQRAGPTVPPQSRYAARSRKLSPVSLRRFDAPVRYDLRYGEPLLDLPLISAWRQALSKAATRSDLNYPPASGLRDLREAICDYLGRRRGVVCAPQDVVIVNGTQQAIALVTRVLVNEGDAVVIEDPHYQFAAHAFTAHGARLVSVSTDAQGLEVRQLPRRGVRLVYVTPAHQFPSGVQMSPSRRAALLDYAARQRCWIVEDDYDGEFSYEAPSTAALRSLDAHGRVVYIGSFSKVVFPALRMGYLVCPPGLRDDFVTAKRLDDLGTGAIEQAAMATFMQDGGFERHLRRAARELRRRRGALIAGLRRRCAPHLEASDARAGMHVVGWLPAWSPARMGALVELGRQRGIGLHPIDPYYERGPAQSGLLLGFAALSVAQLNAATRILGDCLSEIAET